MKTKPKKSKRSAKLKFTRWQESLIGHIHNRILSGEYPSCIELAEELDCSIETIKRNVRYLRDYKGMPVKVSRRPHPYDGYYYPDDASVGQKIGRTFNEREITALFLAQRALDQFPSKRRQKRLDVGFEKIAQLLDKRTKGLLDDLQDTVYFRPFAPEEIDVETFLILAGAVRQRRLVKFCYTKHQATMPALKQVRPYCFICAANSWYMIGFDVVAQDMRTYLLSRLTAPMVTEERFPKPKDFNIDEYLEDAFIVLKGDGKTFYDVVVEFDAWAAAYIRRRQFMPNQVMEELPGGGLRVSLRVGALEEVEAWIAYWRRHAKVIGPPALKESFRAYGEYLVKEYAEA